MFQRALVYLLSGIRAHRAARIVCRANISSLKRKIINYNYQLNEYLSYVDRLKQSDPSISLDEYSLRNFGVVENVIRVELASARRDYFQENARMKDLRENQRGVELKLS